MKAVICDRCKNVFTESNCVEVLIDIRFAIPNRKFDLCRECKKWFYKELDVKEEYEERY